MSKQLKSKSDVIEWYWPDFLNYCMEENDRPAKMRLSVVLAPSSIVPTVDSFWLWYITDGPLGVKHAGHFYSKEDIEYV